MIVITAVMCFMGVLLRKVDSAIVPPPWADPGNNPCASLPGGWQLLYWPDDGKCYKIFHKGPPCPATMELTLGANRTAQCRCPPGSAQHSADNLCHSLYSTEPCQKGEFFAPTQDISSGSEQRWGECRKVTPCPREGDLFHPREGRCYPQYTQGPCPRGQLLAPGYTESPLGQCRCDDNGRLGRYYWPASGTCHQHFTPGPCLERGTLFLPEGKCGCHSGLPQYHPKSKLCYQIGTSGPCPGGHHFTLANKQTAAKAELAEPEHAECRCKDGYILWLKDGVCYRPFTRGPCPHGHMFSVNLLDGNTTVTCEPLPCPAGRLFFPGGKGCHRVGTQGPCPLGQVVLFQDSVKTSVEGISYQGMCGCATKTQDNRSFFPTLRADERTSPGNRCLAYSRKEDNTVDSTGESREFSSLDPADRCSIKRGFIAWMDGSCQQLYTRGSCDIGQWVVPDHAKGRRRGRGGPWQQGKCECLPSFTPTLDGQTGKLSCQPPSVTIAQYLNTQTESE